MLPQLLEDYKQVSQVVLPSWPQGDVARSSQARARACVHRRESRGEGRLAAAPQ